MENDFLHTVKQWEALERLQQERKNAALARAHDIIRACRMDYSLLHPAYIMEQAELKQQIWSKA